MSNYKIDTDKLKEFIWKKWKNFSCTCCKENNWNISNEAYELRAFRWDMIVWGIPIVPIIPITCNNCWNTIFINAVISKILDNKSKDEKR